MLIQYGFIDATNSVSDIAIPIAFSNIDYVVLAFADDLTDSTSKVAGYGHIRAKTTAGFALRMIKPDGSACPAHRKNWFCIGI